MQNKQISNETIKKCIEEIELALTKSDEELFLEILNLKTSFETFPKLKEDKLDRAKLIEVVNKLKEKLETKKNKISNTKNYIQKTQENLDTIKELKSNLDNSEPLTEVFLNPVDVFAELAKVVASDSKTPLADAMPHVDRYGDLSAKVDNSIFDALRNHRGD